MYTSRVSLTQERCELAVIFPCNILNVKSDKEFVSIIYKQNVSRLIFELPSFNTRPTFSNRAFQSAAPYLWNALPSTIRNLKTLETFKSAVKTHSSNLSFK